jgi:hypothetical protein
MAANKKLLHALDGRECPQKYFLILFFEIIWRRVSGGIDQKALKL